MESTAAAKPKKSQLWARDPNDWYVEEPWCPAALFAAQPFASLAVSGHRWTVVDPFAGMGRTLDAAGAANCRTIGFDKVDRGLLDHHVFYEQAWGTYDIRDAVGSPNEPFVLVANPPYGGEAGEEGAKTDSAKARTLFSSLVLASGARATALLLRHAWACGGENSRLLEGLPLKCVYALTPRPSMPPGAIVLAAMRGEIDPETGKPFKVGGGNPDYAYFLFEPGYRGEPLFRFLRKPDGAARL